MTAEPKATIIHATCVALGPHGALLRGVSGAGKSDLALRFLALPETALGTMLGRAIGPPRLVADDYVSIRRGTASELIASAPAAIAGCLEVRGIGIVMVPALPLVRLVLLVDLVVAGSVERLPDPPPLADLLGVTLPLLRLAPFEASAPLKLALAIARAQAERSS